MQKPSLLMNFSSTALESQLQKQFRLQVVTAPDSWVDRLCQSPTLVAIILADDFDQAAFEQLMTSRLLTRIELIFLSHGQPNVWVDRAMAKGACYHFKLPLNSDALSEWLCDYHQQKTPDLLNSPAKTSRLNQCGLLIGSSPAMRELHHIIRKAAASRASVLITGESGVGKELVANTIHLMSERCDQPFVALNCGALSRELLESELFGHVKGAFTGAHKDHVGVFSQASNGTLFLDEVGDMPVCQQTKLLRVLETGEFRPVGSEQLMNSGARIISATNADLMAKIQAGHFRRDIYYRLAQFVINVPPLRERGEDIVGLALHFLAERNAMASTTKEISTDALDKLSEHHWPGNVRELKHTLDRAYWLADDIITAAEISFAGPMKLPQQRRETLPAGIRLDEVEKGVLLKTLANNRGDKSTTANQLGISLSTLYNKLEKYRAQSFYQA